MKKNKVHPAWIMLIGCCFIQFGGIGVLSNCMGIFLPPVCKELGFTMAEFSFHITIRGVVTMLFLPLSGKLIPKTSPKVLLTIAAIMLTLPIGLMAFFTKLSQWYIASVFYGIGGAFLFLNMSPIILSNWFKDKLGLAIGIAMAFSGLGGVVMNPIGTWFINTWGWRVAYLLMAIIGLTCILPFTLFVLKIKPQDIGVEPYVDIKKKIKQNETLTLTTNISENNQCSSFFDPIFLIFICVVSFGAFTTVYINHFPQYAVSVGLSTAVGGAMSSFSMMGNVSGKLWLGWLSEKYSPKITTIIGVGVVIIGLIMIILFPDVIPILMIGTLLYGVCMAITAVSIPLIVSELFEKTNYPMVLSVATMATSGIGGIGTALVGYIYDKTNSYSVCFMVAVMTNIMLVVLLQIVYLIWSSRISNSLLNTKNKSAL